MIRRIAFRYSENQYRHWLSLLLADRINIIEGMVEDEISGRFPNFFKERGWQSMAKHKPSSFIVRIAVRAALIMLFIYVIKNRREDRKLLSFKLKNQITMGKNNTKTMGTGPIIISTDPINLDNTARQNADVVNVKAEDVLPANAIALDTAGIDEREIPAPKDLLGDDVLPGDKLLSGRHDVLTDDQGLADDSHLLEDNEEVEDDLEDGDIPDGDDDSLDDGLTLNASLLNEETNEEILPVDNVGLRDEMDIPGAELDDDGEEDGQEDEENNYYSLGGDTHE